MSAEAAVMQRVRGYLADIREAAAAAERALATVDPEAAKNVPPGTYHRVVEDDGGA